MLLQAFRPGPVQKMELSQSWQLPGHRGDPNTAPVLRSSVSCVRCPRFQGMIKTTRERLFHSRANSLTQVHELFSALTTSSGDQYKGSGGCLEKGGVSDWGETELEGAGLWGQTTAAQWGVEGQPAWGIQTPASKFLHFSHFCLSLHKRALWK